MKKRLILACIVLLATLKQGKAQNGFKWNLNPYHNYPTYVDLGVKSSGFVIDDDYVSASASNLSSSEITFYVKFIFTDFCGKSTIQWWPGGVTLKSGTNTSTSFTVNTKCKETKKDGNQKTGIASVTCEITGFKNLTEEANRAKADKLRQEQELAYEKKKLVEQAKADMEKKKKEADTKSYEAQKQKNNIANQNQANSKTTNNSRSTYSGNNTNSNTTSSANQPNKEEELRKTIAAVNEKIYENRLALEAEQKRTEQQVNAVVGGISQLATGIMANAAAERERKEDNLRRENLKREREKAKAGILLNNFLALANEGNEYAIAQCIEAYYLLEMPYKHFNEIRKEGYSVIEPKNYIDFLTKSYQSFNSPAAKKALTDYYTNVAGSFKDLVSEHKRKAIGQPILAGLFAGGCLIGGDALFKDNKSDVTLPSIIETVGVLGGGALFLSGIVHLVRIGQTNNDEVYIDAKKKLNKIKLGESLSILPTYNNKYNSVGLSVKLNF